MPEASPKSNRANAATSKRDPPPAKAEPISDGGSTSGITDLRREEKTAARERSEKM